MCGGLATGWSLGISDATSTSIDASFVATPLLLAATIGLRWWLISLDDDTVMPLVVHAATWLAFVLTFVLMPIDVIGTVAFVPIG